MKLALALLALALPGALAQDFTQRGYLETRWIGYPETAPGDSGQNVGEARFVYEATYKVSPHLRFAGSLDARTDTHRQVERDWHLDWQDRGREEPAFSVRRLSAAYSRSGWTVEAGKQFLRWGKTDLLTPTDRFAPRDFLRVVDNDFLAVTAARVTYERGTNTWDAVYVPHFTPSRVPLLNQRWVVLPENLPPDLTLVEGGARLPGGPQFGVRWNHVGRTVEGALCFYEGFNHLPVLDAELTSLVPLRVEITRRYAKLRMYGGDGAVPLPWFTVKAETGYFASSDPLADDYVQYVVQLERNVGEWFFVGGYGGEAIITKRTPLDFAPDRGLARAFLGRAGYTIDANRSVAVETAVRQNGNGLWLKAEYSQAFGQHWRATASFALIRGDVADFLGQYRRNSHGMLVLRYSF
jgi:hypothetical protein